MSLKDKRLLRQIKKNLGTQDFENDWGVFLSWLTQQSLAPAQASFAAQIPELLESVEKAYQQDERMLSIADHSLAVSSEELNLATQKVLESKQLIEELLDSLDEGFLVLNKQGHCTSIVSRKAKAYLEGELVGQHFTDILKTSQLEKPGLLEWWDYLFAGKHDFSQLADLAPEHFSHSDSGKTIKLEFKPIYDKTNLHSVILISQDVTEEIEAKKDSARNLLRLQMVQSRYQNAENFLHALNSISETTQFLKSIAEKSEITPHLGNLRRSLHTLKGAMLMVSIAPLSNLVHKIETDFDEHQSLGTLSSDFIKEAADRIEIAHQEFLDHEADSLHLNDIHLSARSVSQLQIDNYFDFLKNSSIPVEIVEKFKTEFIFISFEEAVAPLKSQGLKLAAQQGKQVDFIITSNTPIRLDPDIINPLVQNLSHVINNSIDHGLESSIDREELGKAPIGKIEITASVQGDQLMVKIADDGQGIDILAVRAKAVRRGLIPSEASDEVVLQQIFAEGFSTRENVSIVSGRGVGLSALQVWLNDHQGHVKVYSTPGIGSQFEISLSLKYFNNALTKAS